MKLTAREEFSADDGDTVQHRRVCAIAPMDVIAADFRRHRFAPHMHEEFAIGMIEHGAARFRYRGAEHIASEGQLFVIAPGESHTGEPVSPKGFKYRTIYPSSRAISLAMTAARLDRRPNSENGTGPVLNDPALARTLLDLHHALLRNADRSENESSLIGFLGELHRRHGCLSENPPHTAAQETREVRIAREYIEQHATSIVRLSTLSSLTGLTPFCLIRAFREAMHVPPYAYLLHRRILHSVQLLRERHPLSSVAYLSGFADQSHFTRRFKAAFGMPPGQYARGLSFEA